MTPAALMSFNRGALVLCLALTVVLAAGGAVPDAASDEPRSEGEAETLWRHSIDPEIHESERLMVYQDPRGGIWLEYLDPETGRTRSGGEARVQLDSGAANLRMTFNGPEFGTDASGWAVFYTKPHGGELQIWRARLVGGTPGAAPIFTDGQRRQSILVSKWPEAESTRLIYVKGDPRTGVFHWTDVAAPEREHRIVPTRGLDSPRWINGTFKLVFALEAEGPEAGQIKLLDTDTGRIERVSSDAGVKTFAYGWKAPELGGEILVEAMIDDAAIGIWRQTGSAGWERVQTITPPPASRYELFGSPEPFTFKGRSYISALLKSQGGTMRFRDSEIWVFGIDSPGHPPFAARVDGGGAPLTRGDPETMAVGDRIHIYYNISHPDTGYRIGHGVLDLGGGAGG